jgi:hypothetical protein
MVRIADYQYYIIDLFLEIQWHKGRKLIFFVYPIPKGSEENQFTPLGDGVNKLIFEAMQRKSIKYKKHILF